MPLSPEAHLEILALYPRCAIAFDTGDPEAFAEAFTRDGRFVSGTADPIVGREALEAYVRRRFEESPGLSHHISNVLIEDLPTGVRGRAYGVILALASDGRLQLRNAGTYEDELNEEEGRWRIRSRQFTSRLATGHVGRDLSGPPVA